jgi:hypothetical protein
MITITTTQLNNRGGWSGGIKREGTGKVDGRFGGEVKEEEGRRDQEGRGKNKIKRGSRGELRHIDAWMLSHATRVMGVLYNYLTDCAARCSACRRCAKFRIESMTLVSFSKTSIDHHHARHS